MPNFSSKKRPPRDISRLAKFFVDLSTGNPITEDISPIAGKKENPLPALDRLGRLKDKEINKRKQKGR